MTIVFYCRIRETGYGFILPEDAEKLRDFFTEQEKQENALKETLSAS